MIHPALLYKENFTEILFIIFIPQNQLRKSLQKFRRILLKIIITISKKQYLVFVLYKEYKNNLWPFSPMPGFFDNSWKVWHKLVTKMGGVPLFFWQSIQSLEHVVGRENIKIFIRACLIFAPTSQSTLSVENVNCPYN